MFTVRQENRKDMWNSWNGVQIGLCENRAMITIYPWKEKGNAQLSKPSKGAGAS
jgi:hypothetical protein